MFDHHLKLFDFFGNIEYGIDTHADTVIITPGEAAAVPFLRARNKTDCIYVRPSVARAPHYLLIDDLGPAAAMAHSNKPGRLIIETSPANYQVWIRFDQPLSYDQKKILATIAGCDPEAHPTDSRWGRCPGFLNRKPSPKKVNPDGSRFWARLIAATPGYTEVVSLGRFLSTPQGPASSAPSGGGSGPSCSACAPAIRSRSGKKHKTDTGRDESKAEYFAACEMLRKSHLTTEQIIKIIADHALRRGKRKTPGAAKIYAAKLVASAMESVRRAA